MAVTAKFLADFASFTSAVEKADVQLKGMETSANKVGGSLNRMVDSFSGRKLVQDATLAAEAVERIGGTSKLTSSELARVQAQAREAADKLRAMGQDVPPGIQKIADTIKTTGGALDGIKATLGSVAGAFGVAFSIGAVVNFGKKVFDSASQIHDLSTQLGISTDAVQGFKFAAEQSGSSIDTVGTAINKMNANLAGGEKSTVKALQDAGLQFSAIRNLKPEDAFLAITDAIKQIPDPMTQADVAMALFGKSAAELLPGIKEGFRGVSDSATKMSEDTINSLEAAQDAWERLANTVTIVSGTIIGHALDMAKQTTSSWSQFLLFADNAIKHGVGAALAMADAQEKATVAASKNRDVNLSLAPAVKKTADELRAAEDAAKRHAAALDAMFRKFSGADAAASMRDLDTVFRRMAASGQITEKQINAIVAEALKLQDQGAKLTPRLWDIVRATNALSPGLNKNAIDFEHLGTKIDLVIPKIDQVWEKLNQPLPFGITHLKGWLDSLVAITPETMLKGVTGTKPQASFWESVFGKPDVIKKDFTNFMGAALSGVGGALSHAISGATSIKGAFGTFASNVAKDFVGTALSFIPGIGPALSSLAGPIVDGFKKLFDRNQGRDIVREFAEGLGGFDNLHKQLNALGDEGERLWIKLTQGVGRNNKDQARRAVEEVTAALERHKQKQEEVTKAVAEADTAQTKAYEQAKAALGALDDQIKTLSDSIAGEAPEEFMGIVEQQTRARIEALTKERDAAAKTLEELTGEMTDSVKDVAAAIREIPKEIEIRVRTQFDGRPTPEGFARGGKVLPFSTGGRVPSLTDTVPALLTPGEIVLNAAQQKNVAGSLTRELVVPITVMLPSGAVLAEEVVRVVKDLELR